MSTETEEQKLKRLAAAEADLKKKKGGGAKGGGLDTKRATDTLDKAKAAKQRKADAKEKAKQKKQEKKDAAKAKKDEAKKKKAEAAAKKKADKAEAAAKKKAEKEEAKKKKAEEKAKAKEEKEKTKGAEKERRLALKDAPVMALDKAPSVDAISEARKFVKFTESGLVIQKDTPYEQWENVGRMLLGIEERWQFYIGDWVRFGEAAYGEKYTQAVNVLSKGYSTLANAVYVCKQFDQNARKHKVDFSIYLTLARVPDEAKRLELLDQAEKENWSVKEARLKSERAMPKKRKGRGVPTKESGGADPGNLPDMTAEDTKNYEEAVQKADELVGFLRSKAFGKLPASAKNQLGKVLAQIVKFHKQLY